MSRPRRKVALINDARLAYDLKVMSGVAAYLQEGITQRRVRSEVEPAVSRRLREQWEAPRPGTAANRCTAS